jgi:hypothetical protein
MYFVIDLLKKEKKNATKFISSLKSERIYAKLLKKVGNNRNKKE